MAESLPAELDMLIPIVASRYGSAPDELAEIRQAAPRDPEAALKSYRLMAQELGVDGPAQEPERYLDASAYLRMGIPLNQEKADVNGRDRRKAA